MRRPAANGGDLFEAVAPPVLATHRRRSLHRPSTARATLPASSLVPSVQAPGAGRLGAVDRRASRHPFSSAALLTPSGVASTEVHVPRVERVNAVCAPRASAYCEHERLGLVGCAPVGGGGWRHSGHDHEQELPSSCLKHSVRVLLCYRVPLPRRRAWRGSQNPKWNRSFKVFYRKYRVPRYGIPTPVVSTAAVSVSLTPLRNCDSVGVTQCMDSRCAQLISRSLADTERGTVAVQPSGPLRLY